MNSNQELWLGSQKTYDVVQTASAKGLEKPEFVAASSYDEEVYKQLVNVEDGVATVNISGSLVSGNAGYGIYFGALGYEDIRSVLTSLVQNKAVGGIILNVGSGGGAVAGAQETARLIARVAKVKPMVTYASGLMASAAMWTGSATGYIVAGETAVLGSIGVIRVHTEYSKQMAQEGVTATVIRAGEEKALGSPYEPLSDKAKEVMQSQADYLYDILLTDMAKARGVTNTVADTKFGQGREFIGRQALAAGLIDKVGTIEDAYNALVVLMKARVPASKGKTSASLPNSGNVQATLDTQQAALADNQPSTQGTDMPRPLTDEQLAAMAAGVALPEDEPTAVAPAAAESEPTAEPTAAAPAAEPNLPAMLEKMQADVVAAKIEAQTATAALTAMQAELAASTDIVRSAVKSLGMHYGVSGESVAAMSSTQLLAEHTRLSALFTEKFKGGRVAAATTEDAKPKAMVNPIFAALTKTHQAK
jgi:signal peptide peptidase SppA